jgi:hypothetical protein
MSNCVVSAAQDRSGEAGIPRSVVGHHARYDSTAVTHQTAPFATFAMPRKYLLIEF